MNLFGLAAGFVLTWNLAEWAADLAAEGPSRAGRVGWLRSSPDFAAGRVGRDPRPVGSSRSYPDGSFSARSASPVRFGFRASRRWLMPTKRHDSRGNRLPDRPLWYSTSAKAAVYLFHNGPQGKLFMDGRFQVPSRETFETYIRLAKCQTIAGPGGPSLYAEWGTPSSCRESPPRRRCFDPSCCIYYDDRLGSSSNTETSPASTTNSRASTSPRGISATRNGKQYPPGRGESACEAMRCSLSVGLRERDRVTGRLPLSIMLFGRRLLCRRSPSSPPYRTIGRCSERHAWTSRRPDGISVPPVSLSHRTLPGPCFRHRPTSASAAPSIWTPRTQSFLVPTSFSRSPRSE